MMNQTFEEHLLQVHSSANLKCNEPLASLRTLAQRAVAQHEKICLWENYVSPCAKLSTDTVHINESSSSSTIKRSCLWESYVSPCVVNKLSSDTVQVNETTSSSSKKKCLWENYDSPCIDNNKTSADNVMVYESLPKSCLLESFNEPATDHTEFSSAGVTLCNVNSSPSQILNCEMKKSKLSCMDELSQKKGRRVSAIKSVNNLLVEKEKEVNNEQSGDKCVLILSEVVAEESNTVPCRSPEIFVMGDSNDNDDLFLMLPRSRNSSKRLRRNSIQLFRKSIEHLNENTPSASKECDTGIGDASTQKPVYSSPTDDFENVQNTGDFESPKRKRKHRNSRKKFVSQDKAVSPKLTDQLDIKEASDRLETSTPLQCSTLMPVVAKEKSAPDRPRRKCASQVASSPKISAAKLQSSLEDIYCNRLWRMQMPKERTWESIPECPSVNPRTGVELLFSTFKVRRLMKFDDVPSKTKVRQRRQKAIANGWKPLTKRKLTELAKLLEAKLADLDDLSQPTQVGC